MIQRLPAGAGTSGGNNSFTPELVGSLPPAIRDAVIGAYNDALVPVFLYMVPLVALAVVMLFFIKEKPLETSIKRDAVIE